jgi:hypothetical protein
VALDPIRYFEDVVLRVFVAGGEECLKHLWEDLEAVAAVAYIVHYSGLLARVYYEKTLECAVVSPVP